VEGLVFGYTNGYLEYWLPEEEYGLSFETQKSMVPKGDPEILVGKMIQASPLPALRRHPLLQPRGNRLLPSLEGGPGPLCRDGLYYL
jgi:hypothetical protein